MGVACLFNWPLPPGKSPTQAVEQLHKRIQALGAKESGTFAVDCETYQSQQLPTSTPNQMRSASQIHVFHDTEYPLTVFSHTDSGAVLVADAQFDVLMNKLKMVFSKAKGNKIESRGLRFEWNDFLIKVGIVSIGPSVKGILLEVEFVPCIILHDCRNLMKEVVGGILGTQDQITIPPAQPNELYHPKDKIKLYHEHFTTFRKQVGTGTSAETNAKS